MHASYRKMDVKFGISVTENSCQPIFENLDNAKNENLDDIKKNFSKI